MSVGCETPPAETFSVTTPPAAVMVPPCVPTVPPSTMSRVAVPSCVPTDAVIVARPDVSAFTTPADVTLAMAGALDFHVTLGPEITPPVALVAVAVSMADSPTSIVLAGAPETITAATSGVFVTPVESLAPPPHAEATMSSANVLRRRRGRRASARMCYQRRNGRTVGELGTIANVLHANQ